MKIIQNSNFGVHGKCFIGTQSYLHIYGCLDTTMAVEALRQKHNDLQSLKCLLSGLFFFNLATLHDLRDLIVPLSELEPAPSAVKALSPNPWTNREFHYVVF